jgi:N-acetylmuramoyl-L-alanine amidase
MNKQKLLTPVISVGHGGMIAGEYQTKGKQHTYEDGTTIYEGEFNRDIKNRVCAMLHSKGYPYIDLVPEHEDVSRRRKVNRAKKVHEEQKAKGNETFLIEIHSNAGGGTGGETFISSNASKKSKTLGSIIEENFYTYTAHLGQYQEWRGVKVKDWDMVYKTPMPANLVECFFMDNKLDRYFLTTEEGRRKVASWIYFSIRQYIDEIQ